MQVRQWGLRRAEEVSTGRTQVGSECHRGKQP